MNRWKVKNDKLKILMVSQNDKIQSPNYEFLDVNVLKMIKESKFQIIQNNEICRKLDSKLLL